MRASSSVHIGTSGWNYKHWKGPFYDENLPDNGMLEFYSQNFRTVEINNSFYQLPNKKTFRHWRDITPAGFTFALKANRYITHMKKLKNPKEPAKRFIDAVRVLGDKLGPILFQLPPHWKCNLHRLAEFLGILPGDFDYAFEFRNDTWWNGDVYELLRQHGAAFCIFELARTLSPKEVTTEFVYIRLHGPGESYQGNYPASTLSGWAGAISSWVRTGKRAYCYFDNDQNGYAALNALTLNEMLETASSQALLQK